MVMTLVIVLMDGRRGHCVVVVPLLDAAVIKVMVAVEVLVDN